MEPLTMLFLPVSLIGPSLFRIRVKGRELSGFVRRLVLREFIRLSYLPD
jgi:hypothetical protein